MKSGEVRWQVVAGFGGYIRATTTTLTIQQKGTEREYPISSVGHLLVVGGHNLHSSAVTHLLRIGCPISFFDADGTPLGILRPFGWTTDEDMKRLQEGTPRYNCASAISSVSLRSRLLMIEKSGEMLGQNLFYEGEQEFMHQALAEYDFLVRMDELRRLHRLTSDMYYEIMARSVSPELGFRRRSPRPHLDPVNAMLSLGYSMLFGNCCVATIGAHLSPDCGMLREGKRSLIIDLIDPLKTAMVDRVVFSIAREGIEEDEYECGTKRCHLGGELVRRLTQTLKHSIDQEIIDANLCSYRDSLLGTGEFTLISGI